MSIVRRAFIVTSLNSYKLIFSKQTDQDLVSVVQNENYSETAHLGQAYYAAVSVDGFQSKNSIGFSSNWYKDKSGTDRSCEPGQFSIGLLLSSGLIIEWPILIREYHAILSLSKMVHEIHFPSNYAFRRYLEYLNLPGAVSIRFYDNLSDDCAISYSMSHRALPKEIPIHFVKSLLSFLTIPWKRSLVQNRHLFINDPFYFVPCESDEDGLMINASRLRKNVFQAAGRIKNNIFDQELDESLIESLEYQLARFEYPAEIRLAVWRMLKANFEANRDYFKGIYELYSSLFKMRPASITLPTDMLEEFNMALQIAKMNGVKARLYGDGFAVIAASPYLTDKDDCSFFNEVIAPSEEIRQQYIAFRGFAPENVTVRASTSEEILKNKRNVTKEYDALVYTLVPFNLNPDFRFSHLYSYLIDTVSLLKELGLKEIAIKYKSPLESVYAIKAAEKLGVPALCEASLQIMPKSSLIVGGISSGFCEAKIVGVPYFIYEPPENGFSDFDISQSKVISPGDVCRNLSDLRSQLQKGIKKMRPQQSGAN